MHKHRITFEDFNGQTQTKDLYFNLTEAELTKIQKDSPRGIQVEIEEAVQSNDSKKLLDFFEFLVHKSYGIKSEDGLVFDKSPEIMRQFENSAFYSPLYMSFFQEEGAVGAAFIRAVMPADLISKAEANVKGEGELHAAAQAAKEFKPDARSVFEQAKENLKDHLPKKDAAPETIQVRETPQSFDEVSHRYQPRNQPEVPRATVQNDEPTVQAPETLSQPAHRVPAEAPEEEEKHVLTRAEYQALQGNVISRPPHENNE